MGGFLKGFFFGIFSLMILVCIAGVILYVQYQNTVQGYERWCRDAESRYSGCETYKSQCYQEKQQCISEKVQCYQERDAYKTANEKNLRDAVNYLNQKNTLEDNLRICSNALNECNT